jgi:hypothetical protein
VSTSRHLAVGETAHQRLSRRRLAFNEQLCFFGATNEARPPESAVGSWAVLALAIVIVPWVLLGLMIWMLT